jgi:3-deoxy-D-manno-octulosonic acid (KDO) 8-phosphate synthase
MEPWLDGTMAHQPEAHRVPGAAVGVSAGDSTTVLVVTTVAVWVVVAGLFVATRSRFGYETEPDGVTTSTAETSSEVQ